MLQRVQTVFLILVVIGMGMYIGLPTWTKVAAAGPEMFSLSAFKLIHQKNDVQSEVIQLPYLAGMAVLVLGLALYAVVNYRNRVLQSALCAVNSILMTVLLGIIVYNVAYKYGQAINPEDKGEFLTGFYGLVAAILSNVFANRFIRRDERKVRESNRMR